MSLVAIDATPIDISVDDLLAAEFLSQLRYDISVGDVVLPESYQTCVKAIKLLRTVEFDPAALAKIISKSDVLQVICLREASLISPQFARKPPKTLTHAIVAVGGAQMYPLLLRAIARTPVSFAWREMDAAAASHRSRINGAHQILAKAVAEGVIRGGELWEPALLLHRCGFIPLALQAIRHDIVSGQDRSRIAGMVTSDDRLTLAASRLLLRFYVGATETDEVLGMTGRWAANTNVDSAWCAEQIVGHVVNGGGPLEPGERDVSEDVSRVANAMTAALKGAE